MAGLLVHGLYLGGVFTAISQGVPAGISALIPGASTHSDIDHRQSVHGRDGNARFSGSGLALGLVGVLLVLHDRDIVLAGSTLGWIASFLSLIGITLGTLYQKRYCGGIDWRSGNLVQYIGAGALFAFGAFAFETRVIHWSGELIFALAWLVLVLSIAAVGSDVLADPPIRGDGFCQSVLSGSGGDGLVRLTFSSASGWTRFRSSGW